MIKTIHSSIIVAEVKEKLKIFFEANKVDESIFYPVLKKCMSKFKYNVYPVETTI